MIEGRDYGPGVEQVFGVREYEWVWTIPAASVGDLLRVLPAAAGDVLAAFRDRFSGERVADLGTFLEFERNSNRAMVAPRRLGAMVVRSVRCRSPNPSLQRILPAGLLPAQLHLSQRRTT